jgi:hypothetical protein
MALGPDLPLGAPAFGLSDDEIATIVHVTCLGARAARKDLAVGDLEVPITLRVRKAMKRVRKSLGLTNLEVHGETEIDNMASLDPKILGRIDITLKFLRQFGDEEDYVAIECKRVGAGAAYSSLNSRYVSEGVIRFVNGQYAAKQAWGFMLGYVLAEPAASVVSAIDKRLRKIFGPDAKLTSASPHPQALAVLDSALLRVSGAPITVRHLLVDMTPAAAAR